jgi:toxin ParE1/3/4
MPGLHPLSIAHDSPFYAKKVVHDIREKTTVLQQLPNVGKKVAELNEEKIRELSLHSYRIIYESRQSDIAILAVVHKRRDLKPEDIDA